VIASAKKSLERLRTNYIDLYLIHWPNTEIPLKETMRAMEYLVDNKIVHSIGVSNFSPEQIDEAMRYLDHTRLFADQTEYSLLHRDAEKALIPYIKANDMHIIAYRPLAKGNLTKTHSDTLTQLAQKYKKTANQIALNWLISQKITAIPKTMNLKHLEENAGAIGWKLSDEDITLQNSILL
jgi:diketogulonate reductase-like aldo/keto reductase